MNTSSYEDNLSEYLGSRSGGTLTSVRVMFSQELAHGVTAVCDNTGEYDVYYDRSEWELTRPRIWGDRAFPPGLHKYDIGVLEGSAHNPNVRNFKDAVGFAHRNLQPKLHAKWHDPVPPVIDGL